MNGRAQEKWGIPGPERLRVCPALGPRFFFFFKLIYFLVFAYGGSPLLCMGFSCEHRLVGTQAAIVAAHGPSS